MALIIVSGCVVARGVVSRADIVSGDVVASHIMAGAEPKQSHQELAYDQSAANPGAGQIDRFHDFHALSSCGKRSLYQVFVREMSRFNAAEIGFMYFCWTRWRDGNSSTTADPA